jgi:hypothetical protein
VGLLKQDSGLKQLIASNSLTIHPALYDVKSGLLSFLEGNDQIAPPTDQAPAIGLQTFFENFTASPVTAFTHTCTYGQSWSTPPRLFLGAYGLELSYDSRINFSATIQNQTKTGFDIVLQSTGGTKIKQCALHWLEVPNQTAYDDFQIGTWSTQVTMAADAMVQQLFEQVTFPTPYATPPSVVLAPTGFDIDGVSTFEALATNITTTGFLITLELTTGQQLRAGTVSWLAYPTQNSIGFASGPIGSVDTSKQDQTIKQLTFPYAAPAGFGACNAFAAITKFSIPAGGLVSMITVMNPQSNGPKEGTCCIGKYSGVLESMDGVFMSWVPSPGHIG